MIGYHFLLPICIRPVPYILLLFSAPRNLSNSPTINIAPIGLSTITVSSYTM
jgi:hypothetical protein